MNKLELVDMILPLFIESLEEGEASYPGQLRLRVCTLFTLKHEDSVHMHTLSVKFVIVCIFVNHVLSYSNEFFI